MSDPSTIDQLLDKWDESRASGRELSADELAAASPHLIAELKLQIEQVKQMDWLEEDVDVLPATSDYRRHGYGDESILSAKIPATLGGRYQLENLVAVGGFGQVWRAHDIALQRPVAVKVTAIDCYAEARRVARLKHHGIISVHDVGSENGLCYIVFDLVEGMTLAERIKQGPLNWQESVSIVAQSLATCITPMKKASSTATSSRPTSCSIAAAARFWRISESRSPNAS